MTKIFKMATMALLLAVAATGMNFSLANNKPAEQPNKTDGIIVIDLVGNTLHELSWPPSAGAAPYAVSIVNLSTGTTHSQFSTTATSSLVYGLVLGNNYRITVTKGPSYVITEDQIVL